MVRGSLAISQPRIDLSTSIFLTCPPMPFSSSITLPEFIFNELEIQAEHITFCP
uniref:Uncharacterized protein n=1 Tax=Rhizophora mucronata TaxID=61149 RepID=A0A2P2P1S1_RHIMU